MQKRLPFHFSALSMFRYIITSQTDAFQWEVLYILAISSIF
ncbi:hypothetical protein COPCOM_00286 [Coprococcus comes ATCC 27758]|uniref:Uncharacterized protein n=1 Tax=Coprococcus comes ATCC 27758 TaxID=470146 RepID=C0B565_9FIRM|nr:hypothetical protein COPCOM_00286 [Coprococcus comes ATCC 27758]